MTDKTITAHMRYAITLRRNCAALINSLYLMSISAILTGAQETTSAVLSRLLTKLAEDSVLQEQLREEILAAKAVCVSKLYSASMCSNRLILRNTGKGLITNK
jgi:hypothetical protein